MSRSVYTFSARAGLADADALACAPDMADEHPAAGDWNSHDELEDDTRDDCQVCACHKPFVTRPNSS